jgi:hypothetical protein
MNPNIATKPNSSTAAASRDRRATNQAAVEARKILLPDSPIPTEEELRPLVKELKGRLEFALARKVLAMASGGPSDRKLSVSGFAATA